MNSVWFTSHEYIGIHYRVCAVLGAGDYAHYNARWDLRAPSV